MLVAMVMVKQDHGDDRTGDGETVDWLAGWLAGWMDGSWLHVNRA